MSLSVTWHLASLSAKKVGGGVCLHTCWWSLQLVMWALGVVGEGVVLGAHHVLLARDGVGHLLPLVLFVGGVLSWLCCHLIAWCRPAIVVAWSSSVVVVVVVSHCCHWLWLLTWHSCIGRMVYRHVQVVVSGGQWCGDDGWASWVVVVVVEEEGGCCLLMCLLMPWYTEYIEVILLSFNGHLVQLLECSLIHTHDVLWS